MTNAKAFVKGYTSNDIRLRKSDVLRFKGNLLNSDYKPKTISNKITIVNRFREQGSNSIKNIVIQEENIIEDRLKQHEVKRMYTYAKSIDDMQMYWLIKIMSQLGIRFESLNFVTDKSVQKTSLTISVREKEQLFQFLNH